jgi:dienelactone hydrolase
VAWVSKSSFSLVLVLGACATTPKINAGLVAKTKRVENAGPPVLVIAKSLAEDGTAFAYASGLDPDFTIENVAFAAGHSENTKLLQARLSAGPKHWSLLSLGAVASAKHDPASEYWRQGQFQITTRPPSMAVDDYGRLMPVEDMTLALEIDFSKRHQPKYRRDFALLSLQAHKRGPVGLRLRDERGAMDKTTSFSAASQALSRAFHATLKTESDPSSRRQDLRTLLQLGAAKTGRLRSRDASTHLVYEEWDLPTTSGTIGRMLVAKPPKFSEPRPALIYFCGHFQGGIRHPEVRTLLREGVQAGFISVAVDILGFGHRVGAGAAHIYAAYLSLLDESSLRSFLEEGETALNTVRQWPEVDANRMGVAGISFGGSLAMFMGALREDVAATVAMAGTPGFEAFVRPIGSDSEQLPNHFQAFGGFEALPALIAPRSLRLIMAKHDGDHGRKSSQTVIDAAQLAFQILPKQERMKRLKVIDGMGRHAQSPLARRDVITAMASALNVKTGMDVSDYAWIPSASSVETAFFGIGEMAKSKNQEAAPFRTGAWRDLAKRLSLNAEPWPGKADRINAPGPKQSLWSIPGGAQDLKTVLWRFEVSDARAKVLLLDDSGRLASAFAPILQRCGIDVSVAQPRTFGTAGAWHQAWHRKLLSLAAASLDKPLLLPWLRDLATANSNFGPFDAVLVMGPELGALSLLAAQAGVLGSAHLFLAEAPESLSARLQSGFAPYWTVFGAGFMKATDLDLLAQDLHSQGRLTVLNGGRSLGVPTTELLDPVSNRVQAIERVLEIYSEKTCMVKVPVLSLKNSKR